MRLSKLKTRTRKIGGEHQPNFLMDVRKLEKTSKQKTAQSKSEGLQKEGRCVWGVQAPGKREQTAVHRSWHYTRKFVCKVFTEREHLHNGVNRRGLTFLAHTLTLANMIINCHTHTKWQTIKGENDSSSQTWDSMRVLIMNATAHRRVHCSHTICFLMSVLSMKPLPVLKDMMHLMTFCWQ